MQNPFLLELSFYLRNAYPPFVTQINPDQVKDYVPVFISHKVNYTEFEEKLKFLKENNYETITSDELLSFIQGNSKLRGPTVCLTFDDGHKSIYETAFPLLKKYNYTATVFIVPSFIDKSNWLTWRQVEEMNESCMIDFQSHTEEHKRIPMMQANDIIRDLIQSKKILEDRLNKKIQHLAYPYGMGNKLSQELSKKADYLTNFWGPVYGIPYNKIGCDPYKLVRLKDDYIFRLSGEGRKSLLNIFSHKLKRRKEAKELGIDIYQ